MRATMLSPRLSNPALLSINKDNFKKLLKDPAPILEVFGKIKKIENLNLKLYICI
jgi:hypothetical protein